MTVADTRVLHLSAMGVRVTCRLDDATTGRAVAAAWADAEAADGGPSSSGDDLSVGLGSGYDVVGRDLEELLHVLSPAVTQRAIAANRGELVMLHAAALADPGTGATAVLVAPSGTGKTTASRALGQRFAYLSDETAAITRDGRVLPYRKPLSVIEDGPFKAQYSPSRLGLLTTDRPCHLAALLVIERDTAHVGAPAVERMDDVDAIAALAPQSSYLPSMERPLHRLAEVIEMAGGAHHVTYVEAATLQAVVEDLLRVRA
jgi:hypothetical protein